MTAPLRRCRVALARAIEPNDRTMRDGGRHFGPDDWDDFGWFTNEHVTEFRRLWSETPQ